MNIEFTRSDLSFHSSKKEFNDINLYDFAVDNDTINKAKQIIFKDKGKIKVLKDRYNTLVPKYYVLFIYQDVEPNLYGPYLTEESRDDKAKDIREADVDENGTPESGIYKVDLIQRNVVVDSYSGIFFDNEEEST